MFPRCFILIMVLTLPLAGARAEAFEELNAVFGLELWSDDSLWDDEAAVVANRLGWPNESQTSTDSSYRKYPGSAEVVLGARPYSLALYGGEEKVEALSLMFANKGDAVESSKELLSTKERRERKKALRAYKEAIRVDEALIEKALTGVLGQPGASRYGQRSQTRESVKRWDWKGHAILLAAPSAEYVAVRVLPVAVADLQGKSRIADDELRQRLESRVEKRANGDVILTDIPMVDQGPKGYCVPATWERVMRYMNIPADMYVLAMAGDSSAGGGTRITAIAAGAKEAIVRGGRQLAFERGKITIFAVKKCIDRGFPIMWACYVDKEFDRGLSHRTKERSTMVDMEEWNQRLEEPRKSARKIENDRQNGHVRLIIGYNEATGEIAFSDSWGPSTRERWMTQEEAQAIAQGGFQYIRL